MTLSRQLQTGARLHRPMVVEIHDHDCACPSCEPYVPSVPRELSLGDMCRLTAGGIGVAHVIAFTVDPTGSLAALTDALRTFAS